MQPELEDEVQTGIILSAAVILFAALLPYYTVVKPVRKCLKAQWGRRGKDIALQNAKIYQSLQFEREIRLISLKPSRRQLDEIECETFHAKWDKSSYEALSYAWGDSRLQCAIRVDNQRFMITKNLFAAMKRLRDRSVPRTLWIDGICINQTNDEERNKQVQRMKEIYENAFNVVVWLGEPSKELKHVPDFFDPSAKFNTERAKSFYSQVLESEWWRRIWVVQELLVAQSVSIQYGPYEVAWTTFCKLVRRLELHNSLPFGHPFSKTMMRLREEQRSRIKPKLGLLSLAWDFRNWSASDDRDKLYALLGLLPPEDRLITPRYSDDPQKVFRDFATSWINRYQSLFIINLAGLQSWRSWYPRWDDYLGTEFFGTDQTLFWNENLVTEHLFAERIFTQLHDRFGVKTRKVMWQGKFSAAGGYPAPNCIHPVNKDILLLQGFSHAKVTSVSSAINLDIWHHPRDRESVMAEWRNFACEASGLPIEEIEKEFNLTITAGFFDSIPPPDHTAEYNNARDGACLGRRFFVTSKGSFGLGPEGTKIGDNVCVLLGAPVPFILRKRKSRALDKRWKKQFNKRRLLEKLSIPGQGIPSAEEISYPLWKFIGEAYVRGIMNYNGNIKSDISTRKLLLEHFYLD